MENRLSDIDNMDNLHMHILCSALAYIYQSLMITAYESRKTVIGEGAYTLNLHPNLR